MKKYEVTAYRDEKEYFTDDNELIRYINEVAEGVGYDKYAREDYIGFSVENAIDFARGYLDCEVNILDEYVPTKKDLDWASNESIALQELLKENEDRHKSTNIKNLFMNKEVASYVWDRYINTLDQLEFEINYWYEGNLDDFKDRLNWLKNNFDKVYQYSSKDYEENKIEHLEGIEDELSEYYDHYIGLEKNFNSVDFNTLEDCVIEYVDGNDLRANLDFAEID